MYKKRTVAGVVGASLALVLSSMLAPAAQAGEPAAEARATHTGDQGVQSPTTIYSPRASGSTVIAEVQNGHPNMHSKVTIRRHRWYGWQSVASEMYFGWNTWPRATYNCRGTGTYTYHTRYHRRHSFITAWSLVGTSAESRIWC